MFGWLPLVSKCGSLVDKAAAAQDKPDNRDRLISSDAHSFIYYYIRKLRKLEILLRIEDWLAHIYHSLSPVKDRSNQRIESDYSRLKLQLLSLKCPSYVLCPLRSRFASVRVLPQFPLRHWQVPLLNFLYWEWHLLESLFTGWAQSFLIHLQYNSVGDTTDWE